MMKLSLGALIRVSVCATDFGHSGHSGHWLSRTVTNSVSLAMIYSAC